MSGGRSVSTSQHPQGLDFVSYKLAEKFVVSCAGLPDKVFPEPPGVISQIHLFSSVGGSHRLNSHSTLFACVETRRGGGGRSPRSCVPHRRGGLRHLGAAPPSGRAHPGTPAQEVSLLRPALPAHEGRNVAGGIPEVGGGTNCRQCCQTEPNERPKEVYLAFAVVVATAGSSVTEWMTMGSKVKTVS